MTVTVKIGRRLPRAFAKRLLQHGKNILSLQEQMWGFMVLAFRGAKKAADSRPEEQVVITIENKAEYEDLRWQLEWKIITISSIIQEKEVEEYNEALQIYKKFSSLKQLLTNKIDKDEDMVKQFNSKTITKEQYEKAKEAGINELGEKNIANKLLDLGIIIVVEKSW